MSKTFRILYSKKTSKIFSVHFFLLITFIFINWQSSICQDPLAERKADTARLKIYMDCYDCDFAYFRKNLPYIDFVRDPKLSDVHLLVTEQRTASGGTEYGINFIGSGRYSDLNYKLNVTSPQYDTEFKIWERLLGTIEMGLMPFMEKTTGNNEFEIIYLADSLSTKPAQENYDRWNYWVFRLHLGMDVELEESQNEFSGIGSFRIDRITEMLKFRSDITYYRNMESFQDNSETISSTRELVDSDIEFVYSLGPRWSAGIFNEIRSSTYENMDFSNEIGPAIEYNIFPWDESDRRIFSLGYHLRSNYFDYSEVTIYNQEKEWRASQALRLTLILRQPWGEVETRLEGSHYFHDFSMNRVNLDSEVSVNVTKNFSFFFELNAALIHDQIYLPAGEVTREELLLRQRQLETDYEIYGEFGIRFTFGSIYNNVVNLRL